MRTIRIMLIELKKTLSSNFFLCFILLASMIMSYSVFVFYNDSFYTEQHRFLSNHFRNHCVRIELDETISCSEALKIMDLFDDRFCDYLLLSFHTDTSDETYGISSLSALVPAARDPYSFLYSTLSREAVRTEPAVGCSYVSNLFTHNEKGAGLFLYGTFSIEDHPYTISDFCAISYDPIEVLLSLSDFQQYNRVDCISYVYNEAAALSSVKKMNEEIAALFPSAGISINNRLSESDKNAYQESLLIIAVLLLACVLNYYLIFTYLANKRCGDFMIMRLFGISRWKVMVMLLLELMLYNIVAFVLSMCGFSVYWLSLGDTDLIVHYHDALPVAALFLSVSFLIGMYHAVKLSRTMPIDYKKM